MALNVRLTNVSVQRERNLIYASDDKGGLHCFDYDLNLLQSSSASIHSTSIHALVSDEHYIYSRDVAGNLIRWSQTSLAPLDFLVTQHFAGKEIEEGSAPSPSSSNALALIGEYLYACNAFGTISVFNTLDLTFVDSLRLTDNAFPEYIGSFDGNKVIIADTKGNIYQAAKLGATVDLKYSGSGFTTHSVIYDHVHKRYIASTDQSGGILGLDLNLNLLFDYQFTNDDVEQIVMSEDGEYLYVACFDHYIHVIKNDEVLVEQSAFGPFKFQVNHLAAIDEMRLLAVLESGEIYTIDTQSGDLLHTAGGTNAFWAIELRDDQIFCASESGTIERFAISAKEGALTLIRQSPMPNFFSGRIRRFVICKTGTIIAASTSGSILAFSETGEILWNSRTRGIVRDVSLNLQESAVVACNEIGELIKIDVMTGIVTAKKKFGKPLFCTAFDYNGHIVVGERSLSTCAQKEESSNLSFLDEDTLEVLGTINFSGNHKRIRVLCPGQILVNGNGNIRASIIDTTTFKVVKTFTDWITNTPEDALIFRGKVYVVTYGFQLITYNLDSTEVLDVQFVAEGYPKSIQIYMTPDNVPFLIVGGRNCLMAFRLDSDAPELVYTRFLFDTNEQATDVNLESKYFMKLGSNIRVPPPKIYELTNSFI